AGRRAAEILRGMPAAMRRALAAELGALEHGARLRFGRPFSALPMQHRQLVLDSAHRLPRSLAQAAVPIEALALLAYAGTPAAQAALGFQPGQLIPQAQPLPAVARLAVRAFPEVRPGLDEAFDVVVVGSGAGGAPVARALAEAGWSVAVVEEGAAYTREDFV